jgi:hypothetical protein
MSGTHPLQTADDVEPIGLFLQRDAPDPDHSTTNPCTLLTFSAAPNSSTPLPSAEFYKFGIPRARLDPQRLYVSPASSATASSDEDTSPHTAVANGRFVETSKSSRKPTGSWQSTSSSPAAGKLAPTHLDRSVFDSLSQRFYEIARSTLTPQIKNGPSHCRACSY